jgi:hypothetical protein
MRERLADVMPSVWPAVPGAPPATMRAVVFRRFGGPEVLEVGELPVPPVGEQEVMIRVAAVSVGRLVDLTARAGTHPYARFVLPHALGAEHAGTVVAVGDGVCHLGAGDRVAVFPVFTCGSCRACRDGATEACPQLQIMGVHRPGAYAEYTVVPAANVVGRGEPRLPPRGRPDVPRAPGRRRPSLSGTGRQHGPRRADHRLRRGLDRPAMTAGDGTSTQHASLDAGHLPRGVTDAAERERNPR